MLRPILFLLCSLLVSSSPLLAQLDRPFSAGLPTDLPVADFGGPEVGLLNLAYRQFRNGRIEQAIISYDAILAIRPDWLPALVGKSEILRRVGRDGEADTYSKRAMRIDPVATGFLVARGRNGMLRYLALYPETKLGLPGGTDEPITTFNPDNYLEQRLMDISRLPDSVAIAKILKAKVAGNRPGSIMALHQLMRDRLIDEDLGFMLEGNLDMLNHDYLGAIAAYNQALDFHLTPWPEVNYNRGLAFILIDNYTNGCAELRHAAYQGFSPAEGMLRSLCNF